jgi:hypothetical protein
MENVSSCPHETLRAEKGKCPWIDLVAAVEEPANKISRSTSTTMFGVFDNVLEALRKSMED